MSDQFEFRPAREDEMEALLALVNYAFNEEGDDIFGLKREDTLCAFDGERIAASAGAFPFQTNFNGTVVANAAVTIVTCDPEYRRRGLVRKLMEKLLHDAKEKGQPMASLWASMGALYQRYGYGLATNFNQYHIDPRFSDFRLPYDVPGICKRYGQDDAFPLVKPLHTKAQAGSTLDNIREDYYWDGIFNEKEKKNRNFVIYHDADGVPQGYAVYRQKWVERKDAGPGLEISINDFFWLDMDAYHGLWNFFRSHDLARDLKFFYVADDDPARHLLLEPRMLNKRSGDALWLRVVDVPALLAGRGYTQSGEATITLEGDTICPWNNGTWTVGAEGDGKGGEVRDGGNSDRALKLEPNALASLLAGYASASELLRMGRLACDDASALAEADRLFSTARRPHCSMEF